VLYAVALVLGVGEVLFDTSSQSILPAVVGRHRLSQANSRLYAVELTANQFVGPPLGGVLAGASIALACTGSAAAWLLAAGGLALMSGSFRPGRIGPPTRLRTDIVEGLRFVWRNRVLRGLALLTGGFNLSSNALFAVFVLYAVEPGPMGLTEAGYGVLLTSSAVGSLVGSWIAPAVERILGRRRTLALSIVTGVTGAFMPALTAAAVPVFVGFVAVGVTVVLWNVIAVSLRQRITPDRLLGRVNASYRLFATGTQPLGALLGGLSAEVFGLRPTFALSGLVVLALLGGLGDVTDDAIAAAERDAEVAADRQST
jgi:MFS family permease